MLVDSHCHIHSHEFDDDRAAVLKRARQAGLTVMVVVGTDVASSAAAVALARQHHHLQAVVGCHPHDAAAFDEEGLSAIRELARDPAAVAIGEIGLDFYRNLSPPAAQVRVFEMLLCLAAAERLPVVIHSRSADQETFAMLERWATGVGPQWPQQRPLGVMHCFAGDLALARRYIDMRFLISIPSTVTYPRAEKMVAVAQGIPLAAMVIETDAPYLAPQSRRGRRNEPAYLTETVTRIAQLRGETFEAVAQATAANARRLFWGRRGGASAPPRADLKGRPLRPTASAAGMEGRACE
ncbi:MAG: TatD family hydrolase [Dehalococcoidia bacterium]